MRILGFKTAPKQTQENIFSAYNWWGKGSLLLHITQERCDYIQSRVERIFGREALKQQEVLEIGCGGGLICLNLAQRGAVTFGIDPSVGALQIAREKAHLEGLGQQTFFEQGYGEQLPYANNSFSVIVCLDVLEHVQDLDTTIGEIERVLAPGGIFIFDTINRTLLARLTLIWIGERFFHESGLVPGLHDYHSFIKPHELQAVLTKHHLRIHEMVGFTPRLVKGRLTLGVGGPKLVSYVGYATKGR
ncbi:bifunctional 2-polyprenyl-6-hydroxyphenol methylase/3-demethylubiquinol 3-O-methyltransferase UbiG [Ktedonospora formicarum]|uniref:Ubiquinone biosynthesis O-methyltransferase n=1 Tax=Ktedonospora formicarum TaxID=2778364 RepID=A0A8J3MS48_9CHLR|nr:bifunctional 2-polyprenyl-6-hydroxyphenol methylase/3-demethylubiquinol 3-O-methyltransferase UbiG [Ktedonospora formicarum]GHO44486.1 ubiquinone biosynthesis O-methyltransferase [Ktedonospora formicarum]